jgi:CRISPR-associated protein Cas2
MNHVPLNHHRQHKYLAAYDIRDDRRLQQMHKRLKDFGQPIQKSVFECLLTGAQVDQLWECIRDTIDDRVDWVVLFRLCQPFDMAVRHIGFYDPELPMRDDIVFI